MNTVLESFKTLDENIINHLDVKNNITASYQNNNNSIQLNLEKIDNDSKEYFLSSTDDVFNLAKDNLCISGSVTINNLDSLYGKENDYSRVVLDDTIIGVSINAYSLASKHNVTKPIGEIQLNDINEKTIDYNIVFTRGALADKLFISINFYVKNAKTKSNIFATIDGTILGTIYNFVINLEGTGSIFPIRVIENKEEPLWYVELNYEDLNDVFCQNTVCLNINSAHEDFDKIGIEDITFENKAMWKEILASFFSQLILGLNDLEKDNLYQYEVYNEGTIGMFLQYIVKNLSIEKPTLKNPILLNKKLLIGLDKIMK